MSTRSGKSSKAPKPWWDTGLTERITKKRKARTAARWDGATAPLLGGAAEEAGRRAAWRKDMHRAAYVVVVTAGAEEEQWLQDEFVPRLLLAGLRCAAHHDSHRENILVYIFAPLSRLLHEADVRDVYLQLSPGELREADIKQNAALQAAGLQFNAEEEPRVLVDEELTIPSTGVAGALDPYAHIYAPYVATVPARLWEHDPETQCALSNTEALGLLLGIIQSPTSEGGAGWHLDRLVVGAEHRVTKFFPAKFGTSYEDLGKKWLRCCRLPGAAPVDEVAAVMGAEIALYFAFVGFFTRQLLLPGLLGAAVFAYQVATGQLTTLQWLPVVGLVMAVWCSVVTEQWKREQSMLALRWGTLNYERAQTLRAEYMASSEVSRRRSPVTGKPSFFMDPVLARMKSSVSVAAVTASAGLIVVVVLSVFVSRAILAHEEALSHLPAHTAGLLASFTNALIIQVAGATYKLMAEALTEWENHPTHSGHLDSLILKRVVFDFVNNFFPLFFVIAKAILGPVEILGATLSCKAGYVHGGSPCLGELQSTVIVIFLTRLTVGNIVELLVPALVRCATGCWKSCCRKKPPLVATTRSGKVAGVVTPAERDAQLDQAEVLEEYLEVLITFAYAALFATAFPLAPLIVVVAFVVEMRVDAYKLLATTTRPVPRGANDIGSWLLCFEVAGTMSVVTNFLIVVFVADEFFGVSGRYAKLVLFILLQYAVFFTKFAVQAAVPDQPAAVTLQVERAAYLVNKHVHGVPDEITNVSSMLAAEAEDTGAVDGVVGSGRRDSVDSATGLDTPTGSTALAARLDAAVEEVGRTWVVGEGEASMLPSRDVWETHQAHARRLSARPSDVSGLEDIASVASGGPGIMMTGRRAGDSKSGPTAVGGTAPAAIAPPPAVGKAGGLNSPA